MCPSIQFQGPTVTLFGDRDELDQAIGDELARRGCSTHIITVTMGWLTTTSHAIFRLGTQTGDRALLDLAATGAETTRIVAVCESSQDPAHVQHIEASWAANSQGHPGSFIWHEPFDPLRNNVPTLASQIADEIFSPANLTD